MEVPVVTAPVVQEAKAVLAPVEAGFERKYLGDRY